MLPTPMHVSLSDCTDVTVATNNTKCHTYTQAFEICLASLVSRAGYIRCLYPQFVPQTNRQCIISILCWVYLPNKCVCACTCVHQMCARLHAKPHLFFNAKFCRAQTVTHCQGQTENFQTTNMQNKYATLRRRNPG